MKTSFAFGRHLAELVGATLLAFITATCAKPARMTAITQAPEGNGGAGAQGQRDSAGVAGTPASNSDDEPTAGRAPSFEPLSTGGLPVDRTDGGNPCVQGILCGNRCTLVDSDANNCGECGNECGAGITCVQGACVCPAGLLHCPGKCVDANASAGDCGKCGHGCGPGGICRDGECTCADGFELCEGSCVDLASDAAHCGECGAECGDEQVCSEGACADECSDGLESCGQSCADMATNAFYCGGCEGQCGDGKGCKDGECKCAAPSKSCHGQCVDVSTSAYHCGACDSACPGTQVCVAGACECPGASETLCEGRCVDVASSAEHCGSCEKVCGTDQICEEGECVCGSGLTDCDGACVDVSSSRQHCGTCETACETGQLCQAGKCVQSDLQVKSNCQSEAQAIRPQLRVCNSSGNELPIAGMTLKYWFDQDAADGELVAEIDYGPMVPSPGIIETIPDGLVGADRVVSVTFNAGSTLEAGECTDVQLRIHTSQYANGFDGTNDYSYKQGEWIENELVGLYDATGGLIWGSEPGGATEPVTPAGGAGGAGGAATEPATPVGGAGGADTEPASPAGAGGAPP